MTPFILQVVHQLDDTPTVRRGNLFAWGDNGSGRLGDGTTTQRLNPTPVGTSTQWDGIGAGQDFSLGLRNGELYSWGNNTVGQLGLGSNFGTRLTPTRVGAFDNWDFISVGKDTAFGIRDNQLYAWGFQSHRELGIVSGNLVYTPTLVANPLGAGTFETNSNWTRVSAGENFTLGIRNGSLYGWGHNYQYVLGNAGDGFLSQLTNPERASNLFDENFVFVSPSGLGGLGGWQEVAASRGSYYSLGIRNGRLIGWGVSGVGAHGHGVSSVIWPTMVGSDSGWTHVSTHSSHSLGICQGKLYAWGSHVFGKTGLGLTSGFTSSPTQVGNHSDWTWIATGSSCSLGIRDGKLYSWGTNSFGELGLGDTTQRTSPTQVGTASSWFSVAAGASHTLALRD